MHISKIVAAAALATTIGAGASQAAPLPLIDGTMAVALIGISGTPIGSIGTGTSFSSVTSIVSSVTGEFAPAVTAGTAFSTSAIGSVGSTVTFSATFGTFSGTVQSETASGPVNNRTLVGYILGTFTPDGALSSYGTGPASLTFSFTQTGGPSGSISGSYTLASPPSPPSGVPEPMSLALFGMGLAGLGVAARRKA